MDASLTKTDFETVVRCVDPEWAMTNALLLFHNFTDTVLWEVLKDSQTAVHLTVLPDHSTDVTVDEVKVHRLRLAYEVLTLRNGDDIPLEIGGPGDSDTE